jgi:hypothetical protein
MHPEQLLDVRVFLIDEIETIRWTDRTLRLRLKTRGAAQRRRASGCQAIVIECRIVGRKNGACGAMAALGGETLSFDWGESVAREVLTMRNLRLFTNSPCVESGETMLSRCANSECCKPFLRLREGKLFLVETERLAKSGQSTAPPFVRARRQQRLVEHYWLCDDCAVKWTLVYNPNHGVALAPLPRPVAGIGAAAGDLQRGVA